MLVLPFLHCCVAASYISTVFQASTTGPYPCTRIPSALALPGGDVAAFAECRRWAGDQCFVAGHPNAGRSQEFNRSICMRRSTDGGKTWGPLQLNITRRYSANPSAVFDGNLTRLFFDDTVSGLLYSSVSYDAGATWGTAAPLINAAGKAIAGVAGPGNSAVRMENGDLLIASYRCDRNWTAMFSFVSVFRSTNNGTSWEDVSPLQPDKQRQMFPHLGEPSLAVVRVPSDRGMTEVLVLNARCPDGRKPYPGPAAPCDCNCRGTTLSRDGGSTWQTMLYDPSLPDPDCQGAIIALVNGSVCFSNANSPTRRQDLSVRLGTLQIGRSSDSVTWATHATQLASTNTSAGYSSLLELADGRVGVLWETEGDVSGCHGEGCSIVYSVL